MRKPESLDPKLDFRINRFLPQKKSTVHKDLRLASLPGERMAVTSAQFETQRHQENWVGQITSELLLALGLKCLNFLGEEEN
jgi:hypothetical protein